MPMTRAPAAAARCKGPVSFEINKSRFGRQRRELVQAGAAAKVEDRDRRRVSSEGLDERTISGGADCDQASSVSLRRSPGDLGEMLRRPAFREPLRTQVQDDPRPGQRLERLSRPACVLRRDRQVELRLVDARAEGRGNTSHALHGVQPQARRVDAVGVEPARAFASVGHADAHPRARGRRHERRAQESLQVDRQVEAASGQRPEQPRGSAHAERAATTGRSVVDDQLIERSMAFQQFAKRMIDHPRQVSLGQRARSAARIGNA